MISTKWSVLLRNRLDRYLNTPMDRLEYMQMKLSELPHYFVELYNLNTNHNGTIYLKVQKGMYGLLQAGILVHQLLEERLNEYGYEQSKICLGLWKPISQPISFTLCVDNFWIKYVEWKHVKHLLNVLNMHYKRTINWECQKYLGMHIDWDYNTQKLHVSMLEYVLKELNKHHSISHTHMSSQHTELHV